MQAFASAGSEMSFVLFLFIYLGENIGLLTSLMNTRSELSLVRLATFKTRIDLKPVLEGSLKSWSSCF